ncbi:uncharacterized protein LOC128236760 [Mya arenaria]|uniref:uncharacterized protein LOC128236760 n=1 Tax=Mya arenaria TaxID=6604 RepID=UPI0022E8A337|nr:uncharacterized protein LOC128236760 [Mya arenaria]XP_052807821.1 uncharacterized protein LOC128236760 [Mya arenaria]XP_052807822.1 uncharacterized protein LOC128236760 [Mya arenaria]XP_052807823.1 uncharacterized protein LOC128236760 [Mya arenaria]
MSSSVKEATNLSLMMDTKRDSLVTQAIRMIDFLKEVDQNRDLHDLRNLKRAIYRYEHFWLPLAAKYPDETLCAPLDIEWVWHCHMLAPRAYVEDCETILGIVIDHVEESRSDRSVALDKSASYWAKAYNNEPFYIQLSEPFDHKIIENFESKLSYDIVLAAQRQASFYYQVSLPHYKDMIYLQHAIGRYKMFLNLRKQNPNNFLVPCYDIDLIWHTHMKNPLAYKKDTERILGYLFNHDDTTIDRSDGSTLSNGDRVTKRKWKDLYGESYARPGAMYRGEPPYGTLESVPKKTILDLSEKVCSIIIAKVIAYRQNDPVKTRKQNKLKTFMIDIFSNERNYLNKKKHLLRLNTSNATLSDRDTFEWNLNPGAKNTDIKDALCSCQMSFVLLKEKRFLGVFSPSTKEIANHDHKIHIEDIYKKTGGDTSKICTTSFSLGCLKVTMKTTHTDMKAKLLDLYLQLGIYKPATIPENIGQLWGPVALSKLPAGVDNTCIVATHRLGIRGDNQHFSVRVIHSVPLMTSIIQVFYRDQMVALSHLIGAEQLPLPTQVKYAIFNVPTLNPKIGQRAMLIKNAAGDWGIVTGEWYGYRKGKQGTRVGRKMVGAVSGDPGALLVKLYKKTSADSMTKTSSFIDYYSTNSRSITLDALEADFKSGLLRVSPSGEEVENIALGFSIALLHVLCVPRPRDWEEGKPLKPKVAAKGRKNVMYIPDGLVFFRAAGILYNTPSNHYIRTKLKQNKTLNGQKSTENQLDVDHDDEEMENRSEVSSIDDIMCDDWDDLPGDDTCGGIYEGYGGDDSGEVDGGDDGGDFGGCGGCGSSGSACASAGLGSSCGGGGGGGGGDSSGGGGGGCGSSCGGGGGCGSSCGGGGGGD